MIDLSTEDLRAWTLDTLIPTWSLRVIAGNLPGYIETFTTHEQFEASPHRSILVTTRLAYLFSHGYILRPMPETLAAATHGMMLPYKVHATNGGLPRRVWLDGTQDDPTVDLYNLAFVLFACGWYYSASGVVPL
jgi:mannose/cellobiose epimerase-like protein (N-acyl-D-glucosamine 2-epimerase family)